MQGSENQIKFNKLVTKISYITNILFLFAHVIYLILFLITNIEIMIYVNVVSIGIYILFFILIHFKRYLTYAILAGIEIAY